MDGKRVPLTYDDRQRIETGLRSGERVLSIAQSLSVSPSAVYAEIKRCGKPYSADRGQEIRNKRKGKHGRFVVRTDAHGKVLASYISIKEAADKNQVPYSSVKKFCYGVTKRPYKLNGMTFRFAEEGEERGETDAGEAQRTRIAIKQDDDAGIPDEKCSREQ